VQVGGNITGIAMEAVQHESEDTSVRHVFICHSSHDSEFAQGLCCFLENQGIRCWIAPRDVTPSENWAKAILDAITNSAAIVLISSSGANDSPHVIREVERGVHRRVPVLPIRLERIPPSEELEYFVSSCQWLDACDRSHDEVYALAARTLVQIIEGKPQCSGRTFVGRLREEKILPDRFLEAREIRSWSFSRMHTSRLRLILLVILSCVISVVGVGFSLGFDNFSFNSNLTVSLRTLSPDEGAAFVGGGLKYEWDTREQQAKNIVYEVERRNKEGVVDIVVVPQKSFVEHTFQGPIEWRVRAKWTDSYGEQHSGPWTQFSKVTYFINSLEKIRSTGRLTIAVSDEDAHYEDGKVTGYEVELLREIFSSYLRRNSISHQLKLDFHIEPWSESFLTLAQSPEIDLLAAGLTVTEERSRRYGLVFSNAVNEYPHSLLTRPGISPLSEGKLAIHSLAVSQGTSNETFGRDVLAKASSALIKQYSGSNVYSDMIWGLISGKVDGVLLDKPYATKWRAHFASQGYSLIQTDLTEEEVKGALAEKIAVATRQGNESIIEVVNEGLSSLSSTRTALLKKFQLN
jgi:ABC-type amino acid transport substrate-binding protein